MKSYPVDEAEMRSLAVMDGFLALFFGAATFAGGALVSVMVGLALVGSPTPASVPFLRDVMRPLLLGLVVFFLLLAGVAFAVRETTIRTIKKSARSRRAAAATTQQPTHHWHWPRRR
jgi:hypothetical protein